MKPPAISEAKSQFVGWTLAAAPSVFARDV